jgi:hypothetical protein
MRTHQQMLEEIEVRKALGLPRIELTPEERRRAFGDPALASRDPDARMKDMVSRMQAGLPMSKADKREARRYLREAA